MKEVFFGFKIHSSIGPFPWFGSPSTIILYLTETSAEEVLTLYVES